MVLTQVWFSLLGTDYLRPSWNVGKTKIGENKKLSERVVKGASTKINIWFLDEREKRTKRKTCNNYYNLDATKGKTSA